MKNKQQGSLYRLLISSLAGFIGLTSFSCVSQDLIDGRYLINVDGTVTDIETKLTWQRCSIGQRWDGRTCTGETVVLTWDDANKIGDGSWRQPTIEELRTLVYCSNDEQYGMQKNYKTCGDVESYQSPTINIQAFPNTPDSWYWSSTPYGDRSDYAYIVSFLYGFIDGYNKNNDGRVRLVQAKQ